MSHTDATDAEVCDGAAEDSEAELVRLRAENESLKRENGGLRRLAQQLTAAARNGHLPSKPK